jgi:hypothetical protein
MKGFKGVGLYGILVISHQDYVLEASDYKVYYLGDIGFKGYRGYRNLRLQIYRDYGLY